MHNGLIKILLVEDDEDDYVVLRDMFSALKDWNVRLEWASSYEQALRAMNPGHYDLCLMDYRLDKGTGIELIHKFQKDGFTAPIIILTGQGDHQVDLKAMEDGASDYLEKGALNPQLLERSVRYAIERGKQLEALRQSEKQLKLLSSKLMDAQENERKRLAHDLHDSIGASLTAVKFGLERELSRIRGGEVSPDVPLLEQLAETVEASIKDLKTIYANLRPLIIDDIGALPAIRSLIRQFSQVQHQIKFKNSLLVQEEEIPEHLRIVIYRLCQEALNNIAKHSKAKEVELTLSTKKGAIVLVIRDDGSGFDLREVLAAEGRRGKLGLESMKERVEMSGGSFTILSSKAKGTTIRAIWPGSK